MKKLILAVVLLASPVLASQVLVLPIWAQTKLTPKNATARVDNCAPIGRTANGELVYSMKCDNIPAPPAPPPQAEATEPPAPPAPEIQRDPAKRAFRPVLRGEAAGSVVGLAGCNGYRRNDERTARELRES
jgi:hypothetical protein